MMDFIMKYSIIAVLILMISSVANCQDSSDRYAVYSISGPFFGTDMRVDFYLDDIKKTPICKASDEDFPIEQSDAIRTVLNWAEKEFDSSKNWEVQAVSLKFIYTDTSHCVYVIELNPKDEMQTLNVGLLMDGNLVAPVPKKK